ncbi:hypothetical protein GGR56DRAFT_653500 [Xylariaceae sp. FL0804]|nr:hypothetical protein GGR56DRAFT_653500 [Xylariaceae sp. FL0804]
MPLAFDTLELPGGGFDAHSHLRQGALLAAVAPTVRRGACSQALVMPNLAPPVTTVARALAYRDELLEHSSSTSSSSSASSSGNGAGGGDSSDGPVDFLMTLYLHPDVTPEVVREAAAAGGGKVIFGVKSYPAGVTTGSADGVLSYEQFYPVFEAMQEVGLILNLHGECPSDHKQGTTILNAESKFLPTLKSLHAKFPRLKIILEHCTTADAVEAVRSCGPNVVGTITAHHLFLTVDDWAGDVFNFCKPVAKTPQDRLALLQAVVSGDGKFFLGTDSAPHDAATAKKGPGNAAAGVFTQPYACQLVLSALDEAIDRGDLAPDAATPALLRDYLGGHGRAFYGATPPQGAGRAVLTRGGKGEKQQSIIADSVRGDGVEVVPFRAGRPTWSVDWVAE